jgi:hypothetical protein
MTMSNQEVRAAVRQAIKLAEVPGRVVNAYETAGNILKMLPHLDLPLEEIVDMMIETPSSVSAFEFSPPAAIVEFILPAESDRRTRSEPEPAVCMESE